MEKVKRFIECLVPISKCNLKCGYCYVIQENRRNTEVADLAASPERIGAAFRKERWGGTCYISLCGYGETLLQKEIVEIISGILAQGHYVNVTTNGTITAKIKEILELPEEYLQRLNFCFSFHYNELKRLKLLEKFIENVKSVQKSSCSCIVQLNLCDEYIDVLEEIKEVSREAFGALPQIALTREESETGIALLSDLEFKDYCALGNEFDSTLFDVTTKNFMVKRKEFCYAGDWSFKLDLATGELRSCYFAKPHQNIYEKVNAPIISKPVGEGCKNPYCVNSSHFMTLGVIPSVDMPSYAACRNRVCEDGSEWIKPKMKAFLSSKLEESNRQYSAVEKATVMARQKVSQMPGQIKKGIKKVVGQENITRIKRMLKH